MPEQTNLAEMKLPIGIIVGLLIQTSAAVWWSRGQVATLEALAQKVVELDDRMTIEASVNLRRDVDDIMNDIKNFDELEEDMERIRKDIAILNALQEEYKRTHEELWKEINLQFKDDQLIFDSLLQLKKQ